MEDTPERAAWLAGFDVGEAAGRLILAGGALTLKDGGHDPRIPAQLRAAWLQGYGYGLTEAAGCIPGHHLAYLFTSHRTELVPD